MKLGLKKLKGCNVYLKNTSEPFATICDIVWDLKQKKAVFLKIKTISLIPITKFLPYDLIENFSDNKVKLKTTSCELKSVVANDTSSLEQVFNSNFQKKLLKDIHFELETGLMCDVIFSKNIIGKSRKVLINKISLKDNTIYIENDKED